MPSMPSTIHFGLLLLKSLSLWRKEGLWLVVVEEDWIFGLLFVRYYSSKLSTTRPQLVLLARVQQTGL